MKRSRYAVRTLARNAAGREVETTCTVLALSVDEARTHVTATLVGLVSILSVA